MTKASIRIVIPLYNGVGGQIDKNFYSTDGQYDKRKVYWLVPSQVYGPGGASMYKVKVVPTLQTYQGEFEFNVWDKQLQAKPLLVATIKFNVDTNSYVVSVTERYACLRLVMELNMIRAPIEPCQSLAFRNQTPYGQWEFKDNI